MKPFTPVRFASPTTGRLFILSLLIGSVLFAGEPTPTTSTTPISTVTGGKIPDDQIAKLGTLVKADKLDEARKLSFAFTLLYPDDPRAKEWQARLDQLGGSTSSATPLVANVNAQTSLPSPPANIPRQLTIKLPGNVNLDLVWIEPGAFEMGSEKGAVDETPVHRVVLTHGFWLGKYEITQSQWQTTMAGKNPSFFKGNDLPLEGASWGNAMAFCEKLTAQEKSAGRLPEGYAFTLPTEAQWEYACRAGTTSLYAGSDKLADMGWYKGEPVNGTDDFEGSAERTHPVGQKQPNPWGLYDMCGNVAEWCFDLWDFYPEGTVTDPQGPGAIGGPYRKTTHIQKNMVNDGTVFRINRGGNWYDVAQNCRVTRRKFHNPDDTPFMEIGFRVALAPIIPANTVAVPVLDSAVKSTTETTTSVNPPGANEPPPPALDPTIPGKLPKQLTLGLSGTINLNLVWIEPGIFKMGNDEGDDNVKPAHRVALTRGFWLGKYEVTQKQWHAVMGTDPSFFQIDFTDTEKRAPASDKPVEQVSWEDARAFCQKLTAQEKSAGRLPEGYTYTLPTEAQWEYACRAGSTDNVIRSLDLSAWYFETSQAYPHSVGEKHPNAWELYDMLGNVAEWCLDSGLKYHREPLINPMVSGESGTHRIFRGGSWTDDALECSPAFRDVASPTQCLNKVGFRIALSPSP